MTTTDLRSTHRLDASARFPEPAPSGPFLRIVLGSLALGALGAAGLALVALPGAVEHTTTGVVLLAFAAGWAQST